MIKIFLIETQKIVREGLRVLLEEESDLKVFAQDNKDIKISLINYVNPDVILISLDNLDEADFSYLNIFHNLNRNDCQLQYFNRIKIIVFAGKVDEFILNKALQFGCEGYLLKESSIEELKQAIRSVHNGYKHIGNSVFSQIKQLSFTDKAPVKILEENLVNSQEYYQTGLLTTSTNEVDFENIGINNSEIVIPKTEESLTAIPQETCSESLQQNWLRTIGSSVILISLGCAAGILGVLSIRDRAAESFSPIAKYGLINGEIVSIKTPYLGTMKQLAYQIGDLVEADKIVAKLEPQYHQKQEQVVSEIVRQIKKVQQQIEVEKQLLAITQSRLNSDRQKLQQLSAQKSEFKSGIRPKSEEETVVRAEVEVALAHYKKLHKLKEEKVVSQREVDRAKQLWTTAQKELIQIQNNPRKNLSDFSNEGQTDKEQNLGYLLENIERWEIQAIGRENTIKLLAKNLSDANSRLNKIKDSDRQQQLINIKAPFTGVIYQIHKNTNEILDEYQTIIELLNCNNLWIELIVDANILAKINLQQPAMLNLDNYQHSLSGRISSIEPLDNFARNYLTNLVDRTSSPKSNSTENLVNSRSLFKIKIDFSIPDNYTRQHKFCGLEKTALVTFNY